MSILPLLLLLSTPALPTASTDERDAERRGIEASWQECLYDRADALAGYARVPPERAAELALAGCEEKARVFRRLVSETSPADAATKLVSEAEGAMKRYALIVARASAAVPLEPSANQSAEPR